MYRIFVQIIIDWPWPTLWLGRVHAQIYLVTNMWFSGYVPPLPVYKGLISQKSTCLYIINRDYLTAFWLSPEVSTRDPIISPRGLILRYSVYHIFQFNIWTCLMYINVSKTEEWRKFCVMSCHLFISDGIKWPTLRAGHDNLSPFKMHDFRLSSRLADNQLAGKSLSHMQTLGYHGK